MNSREYRLLRQRHRAARPEAGRQGWHPDIEAERLIGFARMWAPFGGAPEEDVLVNFGLTTRRFIDRLWHAIAESKCDEGEMLRLASAYPRQRNERITPSR